MIYFILSAICLILADYLYRKNIDKNSFYVQELKNKKLIPVDKMDNWLVWFLFGCSCAFLYTYMVELLNLYLK